MKKKTPSEYALSQKILKLVSHPDFVAYTRRFRKQWHIPDSGLHTLNEHDLLAWRKWSHECTPSEMRLTLINREIYELLEKNHLTEKWLLILKNFLLYDEIETPLGVAIQWQRSRIKDRWSLSVGVDEDTSKEDYSNAWIEIKKAKRQLKMPKASRTRNLTITKRDNRVYELKKQNKTTAEIINILMDEMGDDGAMTANDVRRIISRMKTFLKL